MRPLAARGLARGDVRRFNDLEASPPLGRVQTRRSQQAGTLQGYCLSHAIVLGTVVPKACCPQELSVLPASQVVASARTMLHVRA